MRRKEEIPITLFLFHSNFLLKCLDTCTHTTLGQISPLTGKKPSRYIYMYENVNTLLWLLNWKVLYIPWLLPELTVQLSWFENKAAFLNECPIFFVQTYQDKQIHVPIFTGQEVLMNNKFLFLYGQVWWFSFDSGP